jgi:hypothetical protein
MRLTVFVLVCVAVVFGTWDISAAQTHATVAQGTSNVTTGRFQLVHAYYSTDRQGTLMIDSQTGRVFELASAKDKDGKEIVVFQQVPIGFCTEPTCTADYGWGLRPVSLDVIRTPKDFGPDAVKGLER